MDDLPVVVIGAGPLGLAAAAHLLERGLVPLVVEAGAPTFLAMTGYEQVRSIAAELAGDREAAARSELVLPDTGVCGGAGLFDDPDGAGAGGCCAPAPQLLQIGSVPARA